MQPKIHSLDLFEGFRCLLLSLQTPLRWGAYTDRSEAALSASEIPGRQMSSYRTGTSTTCAGESTEFDRYMSCTGEICSHIPLEHVGILNIRLKAHGFGCASDYEYALACESLENKLA